MHSGWRLLLLLITTLAAAEVFRRLAYRQLESGSGRWLTRRGDGEDRLPFWFLLGLGALLGVQIFWYLTCPEKDPLLPLRGLQLPSRLTVVVGMVVLGVLLTQLKTALGRLYGFMRWWG